MKRVVRLTESDLHRIVENTVKRILSEEQRSMDDAYWVGQQYNHHMKDYNKRKSFDEKHPTLSSMFGNAKKMYKARKEMLKFQDPYLKHKQNDYMGLAQRGWTDNADAEAGTNNGQKYLDNDWRTRNMRATQNEFDRRNNK